MEPIILASESPRRQEFFRLLGLPFTCIPSNVDESFDPSLDARVVVEELAARKVKKVLDIQKSDAFHWIFGADTLITLEGTFYGKPADRDDARTMLRSFQGRTHQVISGLALYNDREKKFDCRSVVSDVSFAPLTDGEIEWYLNLDEWEGVAGAYQIQGLASCFITGIKGSFSSVMGLPLREFYAILRDNGYRYGG